MVKAEQEKEKALKRDTHASFVNEWITGWNLDQRDGRYIDPSLSQTDSERQSFRWWHKRLAGIRGRCRTLIWLSQDTEPENQTSFLKSPFSEVKKNERQRWMVWHIDLGWSMKKWMRWWGSKLSSTPKRQPIIMQIKQSDTHTRVIN